MGWSVAAAAFGAASPLAIAIETSTRPGLPVALLIVDERFELARSVALSLATPGIRRVPLPRDVLDLWQRQLAPVCLSGRHALAGVTTERGFFLLQTLAADHRLRVLSRTVHALPRAATHEPLVSWMLGPKS